MYKVYVDNTLVYDPRLEELALISPKVTLEENKAGSFSFKMPPTHPYYDAIKKRKSVIEVYQDEELLFSGICTKESKDFYSQKTVTCEGELSYLNDSIQRPARYQNATVRGLLEAYIANHNAQVNADRQFTIGVVTVEDNNDSLYRYTNMESTMKAIKEDLVDDLGGIIRIRHEGGVKYIDYLADSQYTNSQTIEIGENLLDFVSNIDVSEIATAIIPLGAKREETAVEGLETRLDIKSINDGLDYVHSPEAVENYGWIYKPVEWDDVTDVAILKSKGEKYLSDIQFENMVIEAKAIDLHLTDKDIERFKISDEIRVVSKPHGLNRRFRLAKMTIYLNQPEKNTVKLGKDERTTLSAQINKANADIKKAVDSITPTDNILKQARDNATALINMATNGYIVLNKDEKGNPFELLIMDTADISTAKNVWRWNVNGLGYSSTGYKGEYGLAMTMDGHIVGERITIEDLYALGATIAKWKINEKSISSSNDSDGEYTRIDIDSADFTIDGVPEYSLGTYEYTNIISATITMEANGVVMLDGDVTWGNSTGIECKRIFRIYNSAGAKLYEWSDYDATDTSYCGVTSLAKGMYTATFSVEVTDVAGHEEITITCEPWFEKKITNPSSIHLYSVESLEDRWISAIYNGIETFWLTKQGLLHTKNAEIEGNVKSGSTSNYTEIRSGEVNIVKHGKKTNTFNQAGNHFYNDGTYIGKIGTNKMASDSSKKGLVFDLEQDAAYTTWASRQNDSSDYTMKWSYCSKQCGDYDADMLHAGCGIDMHGHTLKNVGFEGGGINGTLKFKQIIEIGSDGTPTRWADASLTFTNGILTDGKWYQG